MSTEPEPLGRILDVATLRKLLESYPDDAQILFDTPDDQYNVPMEWLTVSIDAENVEVTIKIEPPIDWWKQFIDTSTWDANADLFEKFGLTKPD